MEKRLFILQLDWVRPQYPDIGYSYKKNNSDKEKFFHLLIDGAGANVTVDSPNGRVIHLLLKHCLEPKKRIELIEKILNGKGGKTEVDAQDAKYKGLIL